MPCVLSIYLCWASFKMINRLSSRLSFDNTGNGTPYNLTRIINMNATLNLADYKGYSPLFLSCVPSEMGFIWRSICDWFAERPLSSRTRCRFYPSQLLSRMPSSTSGHQSRYISAVHCKNSRISTPGWWRNIAKVRRIDSFHPLIFTEPVLPTNQSPSGGTSLAGVVCVCYR